MDSILLHRLKLWTRLGVTADERSTPQQVLLDIELLHPSKHTADADHVGEGIDYAEVVSVVSALTCTERNTVEKLAEDIAQAILKRWKPKNGVKVSVTKFPMPELESVTLTITRP